MMHLNLQWKIVEPNHVALIFDKAAWTTLQATADMRGLDTQTMIAAAVANLIGPVVATRPPG